MIHAYAPKIMSIRLSPLFTDLYQLTMAQAYFASGKHQDRAVFEMFFRRCPFGGEYAVLAGFDLIRDIINNFYFEEDDISYLKTLPGFTQANPRFFDELRKLNLSDLEIRAIPEGSLVFAKEPLLQVKGPLLKAQLLESALLNAVNFSTLIATYARRIRNIAGERQLVEFGMRRAQGPNGAMTATRASYLGGFDATSNVLAGKSLDIPVVGTMAHSFVQSFSSLEEEHFFWRGENCKREWLEIAAEDGRSTNAGEWAAFMAYSQTFPDSSLLLIDTYDTLNSGLINAIRVFKMLKRRGHHPLGIRLDSGDLVYLSQQSRQMLDAAGFHDAKIFASNELDERVIESIQEQGSKINAYGVGTHLVTAFDQPALGGVYKLVELNGKPRMKISQQTEKLVIPSQKEIYRLHGADGSYLLDFLTSSHEPSPQSGKEVLALHTSDPFKQVHVVPSGLEPLLQPLFQQGRWLDLRDLREKRRQSLESMRFLRSDIWRIHNPAPYKVSVSESLSQLMKDLYQRENPTAQIR
jgi:nicotinate phosphoribosyltransferase